MASTKTITMKTLPALPFIAALAAFILFPVNFEIAVSLLVAAGLTTIMISDYSRSHRSFAIRIAPRSAAVALDKERLGLAA